MGIQKVFKNQTGAAFTILALGAIGGVMLNSRLRELPLVKRLPNL